MCPAPIERWAGLTRSVSNWDGLRRDPELWYESGDCFVHLYAPGKSRRGPSFCVPFQTLQLAKCGPMFSLCFAQRATASSGACNLERPPDEPGDPTLNSQNVELYVPAPENTTREASFQWHIDTRNFFAFVFRRPLVGTHLGQSMVDLHERMRLFRSDQDQNHHELLDYADSQGYRDFVDCTDHALAMLYYAEHYKLRDVWIDAFAHCVGMNERLVLSPEFAVSLPHCRHSLSSVDIAKLQSRLTKALITRAHLEMSLELGQTTVAVRNFLEEDLSSAFLGLTDGARCHLDQFRSFMHSFYINKFGYWPPHKDTMFSQALYRSLCLDFKSLYDYLVDVDSTADLASQKLASGGICVLQNVKSFDKRHAFPPLPHPMPLLPCEVPSRNNRESRTSLKRLTRGSKQRKDERSLRIQTALMRATNVEIGPSESPIIQAYIRFERQSAMCHWKEKVSVADARKVRWLLIYGTLQYLISALRAPIEVRDTERFSYPLCCLITERSQRQAGMNIERFPDTRTVNLNEAIDNHLSDSSRVRCEVASPTSFHPRIEPDCQNHDYLLHTNTDPDSRRTSVDISASSTRSQPSRTSSVRSHTSCSLSCSEFSRSSTHQKPQFHFGVHVHEEHDLNSEIVKPPSRVNASDRPLSLQPIPKNDTSWLDPVALDSACYQYNESSSEVQSRCAVKPLCMPWIGPRSCNSELIATEPLIQRTDDNGLCTSHADACSLDTIYPHNVSLRGDMVGSRSSKFNDHGKSAVVNTSSAEKSGLLGGLTPIKSLPALRYLEPSPGKPMAQTSICSLDRPSSPRHPYERPSLKWPVNNSCIGVAITDSFCYSPIVSTYEQTKTMPLLWMHTSPLLKKKFDIFRVSPQPDGVNTIKNAGKSSKSNAAAISPRNAKVGYDSDPATALVEDERFRKREKKKPL